MAKIPGHVTRVCQERLLGPALSPGHSPTRTVCPGRSCSDTTPKRKSSSEVDTLTTIREPIPFLHRCNRRAGRDEMHHRLENDDVSLSGTAARSSGTRSATDLLFLDGWDFGCCPSCIRAQERTRNSVSEDID